MFSRLKIGDLVYFRGVPNSFIEMDLTVLLVQILVYTLTLVHCSPEVEMSIFIEDSDLGKDKNFGFEYFTFKVPAGRFEADEFAMNLESFLAYMKPLVWTFGETAENRDLLHLEASEYLECFRNVLETFPEFHGQAMRRSLIFGLLCRFEHFAKKYEAFPRVWRILGSIFADALLLVDSLIPEIFFELNSEFSMQDSARFVEDINRFIANTFVLEFDPIFQALKQMKYAGVNNPQPLILLLKGQQYKPIIKMLLLGEAQLNPERNPSAWLQMIENPDTSDKFWFIYTLLKNGSINLNWKLDGLDFLQLAIRSKQNLLETISTVLSLKEYKMTESAWFYMKYAQTPEVCINHTPNYQRSLIERILYFIK